MTPVETVARAIERTMFADHELPLDIELHEKYCFTARAAMYAMLASMREPSPEMREYLQRAGWDTDPMDVWRAMLDAYAKESGL